MADIMNINGNSQGSDIVVRMLPRPAQFDCACELTRRAGRCVSQLYDLVLAPSGLKSSQFILLRVIAEAGEIAQSQIGKEMSVAVETLTRRLSNLRKAGWVQLRVGIDRREHLYSITEAGREKLDRARPYWQRAQQRLLDQLGETGWREMEKSLHKLALAAAAATSARRKNIAG